MAMLESESSSGSDEELNVVMLTIRQQFYWRISSFGLKIFVSVNKFMKNGFDRFLFL